MLYGNYAFFVNKRFQDITYWNCLENRTKHKCPCRITINEKQNILRKVRDHNHSSDDVSARIKTLDSI